MIVYRLTKSAYALNLSGKGAELAGGRWNNKGTALLYTSSSRALCLAETMVHISTNTLLVDFTMVSIEVMVDNFDIITTDQLPPDWRSIPAPASTRQIGDQFYQANQHLVLQIPSVIVPQENNYLINPNHPDKHHIRIIHSEPFTFDTRFFKKETR
jgi:RES domain-containing protein